MNCKSTWNRWVLPALLGWVCIAPAAAVPFDLEARTACQMQIEDFRLQHRIWPEHNGGLGPDRRELIDDRTVRSRVRANLELEQQLVSEFGIRFDWRALQAELDRMARNTRMPERLQALFEVLGNDPLTLAECLARPALVERHSQRLTDKDAGGTGPGAKWGGHSARTLSGSGIQSLSVPEISSESGGGEVDAWRVEDFPDGRFSHTSVWTGSEMIVWGGSAGGSVLDTGSRYDPVTDSWRGVSTRNAPAARTLHVAVWTGAHMVVWGGEQGGTQQLGNGSRYDPVSDTWLPMSSEGAPTARSRSTAVWTGTEMIVFGGSSLNSDQAGGGRYNPWSDSWQSVSLDDAPLARHNHQAVWTGGEMIIWGGQSSGDYLGDGARYNPTADAWYPVAASGAPSARIGHTAVWTGKQMIVWGGRDDDSISVNTGASYNPTADAWTATETDNTPGTRVWHKAVWIGSEMLVWGGNWPSYPTNGGRYDPVANNWSIISADGAPQGRQAHSLIWDGSEMIVWGGTRGSGSATNSGARYDPVSDTWTATADHDAPPARNNHVSVWTGSEKLIWGGDGSNGARYDPVIDHWSAMSMDDAPGGRIRQTAVWTGTEMIVWGGISFSTPRDTGGRYNPATDTWQATSLENVPDARYWHSAVWTGDEMIVWGGYGSDYLDTGARYRPDLDEWTALEIADAPEARLQHSAFWTGELMLIWGGRQSLSTRLNTGGRYDPASGQWSAMTLVDAPDGRYYHSDVWTGTEMVVWSGNGGGRTGGRYNPQTDIWRSTTLDNAPSRRQRGQATVWTGSEMIVWSGWSTLMTQTGGRYDPVADEWRPTTLFGAPAQRDGASAVWTGNEMMVWGGHSNSMGVYDPQTVLPAPAISIVSSTPGPSIVGESVMIVVEIHDPSGSTPVDGMVEIQASDGPSCSDNGPPSSEESLAIFACSLGFTATGEYELVAFYSGSATHADLDNSEAPFRHRVLGAGEFSIGGATTGLAGSGLMLTNNGVESIEVAEEGAFEFVDQLADGAHYAVTVAQQPSAPRQTCQVAHHAGQIDGADVDDLQVACETHHYTIGGTVVGLEGEGLVLEVNNADALAIEANGEFVFPTALPDTSAWLVTVATQPGGPAQTCQVSQGGGVLDGSDVIDVLVECVTNLYSIGGIVSGLKGSGLVLRNNGGDDRAISGNGSFAFASSHQEGTPYEVTVFSQPIEPAQTCTVSHGSGMVETANVSNIAVTCESDEFIVTPSAGANGQIDPADVQFVEPGGSAIFEIIPDPGHAIDTVAGTCPGSLDGHWYTTGPIADDCTVEVSFRVREAVALVFATSPGTGLVGEALKPLVAVLVVDEFDEQIVEDDTTIIEISLETNPTGAVLSGLLSAQVAGGRAEFDDLSIDRIGQGYRLRAEDQGEQLTLAVGEAFDVVSDSIFSDRFRSRP